jgi:hypothetical protein
MAKKATKGTREAGAIAGKALLAGLMPGLAQIASPQARLNEIRPTPMAVPKRGKGKGK